MIHKTSVKKAREKCRKWAIKRKTEIYERFNHKCADCGENDLRKLTIHHIEYKESFDCLKVLCNNCHRRFHDLELRKKMMILCLADFKKNNIPNDMTVGEYKKQLYKRIDKIPIQIVTGLGFDGIPDYIFSEAISL